MYFDLPSWLKTLRICLVKLVEIISRILCYNSTILIWWYINGSFNTKFQHQTIWQDLMNRGVTNTKDRKKIYSFYTKS